MLLLKEIILTFRNGEPPMTSEQLAKKMDFPVRLIRDIIYELQETGIISETVTKSVKQSAYQPAQDIENLSVGYVIEVLDKRGTDDLNMEDSKEFEKMMKVIDGFSAEIKASKNNKLVHELG
jgi:membrane protein